MNTRVPLQNIKFEYVLAALLTLIVVIFIYGRQLVFHEMDVNHRESVDDMEYHFDRISSGQYLRNLSHLINIQSVNYVIREDEKDKQALDETMRFYQQTVQKLKTKEDEKLLENILKGQEEKIHYIMSLLPLSKGEKVKELSRPKLRRLNARLREDEVGLIDLERQRYQEESEQVDEARRKMVKEITLTSTILLFLTIGLSGLIIYFGKRIRLQSQGRLEAIRSRDDVLSVVSHDLKNPLGTIKLNCQMAMRNITGEFPNPEKIVKNLDGIQKAVFIMQTLIQDLLEMRKIESGKMELEVKEENLNELVVEAESLLNPMAEKKSIAITNTLPSNPLIIKCDKIRVLQILSNLISNALKFSKEGGKVEVRVLNEGEAVHLAVADQGPGISEKDIPHLFDRFWQAKATAKQGTGLGLSIAQGLVHAHGGRIWVESRVNRGTTFHFTLPV
ncbi:sensor histidine kinase [Peredibacter starrii]|uniref:histidine kinase n=1 Tax=Peredibacter starrii TaxID=28202 RepID=A0AAX4HTH3_9BACT|nr:HAMP domain-containing sensor histidine kinase [Peredibacter starrii]WPU66614.1 HAMP domain-containing sensor histidine kinase [Peredibacter starrii]